MDWFSTIKDFYNTINADGDRLYTKEKVAVFVSKGKITAQQYEEITGEAYGG